MSWAASINTENCFERYSFNESFAPSPRRTLARSSSSNVVPTQRSLSSSSSSRAQSASPAPSKRSFFSISSKSRSGSVPNIVSHISAPILLSSTNPLVLVRKEEVVESRRSLEETKPRTEARMSEILADFEDEEEDEETQPFEDEDESRFFTSLSPPPANRPLPSLPEKVESRKASVHIPPQIQIHHPQPKSHFSMWSLAPAEDSRASSPTESNFSRRDSDASWYTASMTSTPDSETFEYNPYISKVAERGFQADESLAEQLTPSSPHDHQQVTALEEYLSDLGFL